MSKSKERNKVPTTQHITAHRCTTMVRYQKVIGHRMALRRKLGSEHQRHFSGVIPKRRFLRKQELGSHILRRLGPAISQFLQSPMNIPFESNEWRCAGAEFGVRAISLVGCAAQSICHFLCL